MAGSSLREASKAKIGCVDLVEAAKQFEALTPAVKGNKRVCTKECTTDGVKKLKLAKEEADQLLMAKGRNVQQYGNPPRANQDVKLDCDICDALKHKVRWLYRNSCSATKVTGGVCYCCFRATQILQITRKFIFIRYFCKPHQLTVK